MKKIININLSGRVIPIEDSAYDSLQRYVESLRRYFAAEEGRDEIINDIESRIAELMNDKIKKGASVVTEYDIEEIISAMGRVEDFEAADGAETAGASTTTTTSSYTAGGGYQQQQQGTRPRFTGRLYRDANDKFLGGVCAGIANYVNVDPAIVRILFAIITFGGFGFGFLLYILLWIVLPSQTLHHNVSKRFYRNPDDRVLGGVAGGIAAYFNKNPWTVRAIFAAPLVLNILFSILNSIVFAFDRHDGLLFPNFFFGSFTGTFILAYIILWIVLPEAKTPYQKMEMRGEKVDINTIRQNVQEGMETFSTRAKAWGEEVRTSAQNMSERAQTFMRTQGADFAQDFRQTAQPAASGIGHAFGVIFKAFFLFIAGVIAFALFVMLLVFIFGGVAQPVNTFLIEGFWQRFFLWGTIVLFFAVPLIGIITWIIRRVMNVRSQNRYLGWTFGGLWTLGWLFFALFVSSIVKDFRFVEKTESEVPLARSAMNKLTVQVPGNTIRYSGNFGWLDDDDEGFGWDITDDSLKLSNIRVTVRQSEDSFYYVTTRRYSAGSNRATALQRAENIEYSVISRDSVLMLGTGFGLGSTDKFRGQKVLVEIKVPVGKQIRFDNSVSEKLNPYDVRIGERDNNRRRNWNRRRDNEWDNNWYYDWTPDTDYYMTADGRLKEVGIPAMENSETPEQQSDTIIRTQDTRSIRWNEEEIKEEVEPEFTTHKKELGDDLPFPLPMPLVNTIF